MHQGNRFTMLTLAGALAACGVDGPTQPESIHAPAWSVASDIPITYLVTFRKNAIPGDFEITVAGLGGSVTMTQPLIGMATVVGIGATAAVSLAQRVDIEAVEPEGAFSVMPSLGLPVEAVPDAEPVSSIASPGNPAIAAVFARQWHLRAIHANVAWAAGKLGSPNVTVAILDTGIDPTHADLNGRVDLSRSVSFIPSDDALVNTFFPGSHSVTDLHYHGSHIAATISSNAVAAAGVTSTVRLFGVKVCNVNGSCPTSAVLNGILHAASNGAHVANLSLAGPFAKSATKGLVSLINRVMSYAQRQGLLLVVAAGNAPPNSQPFDLDHDGNLFHTYCNSFNVVCVAATGPTSGGTVGPWLNPDNWATYSNYGRSAVSVAAPGGTNGGLVWAACSRTSLQIPACQGGSFVLGLGGTSMATPHASGVAALLVERYGRNPQTVRSKLQQTADDINLPGTDPFSGKGRVNAARAAGVID